MRDPRATVLLFLVCHFFVVSNAAAFTTSGQNEENKSSDTSVGKKDRDSFWKNSFQALYSAPALEVSDTTMISRKISIIDQHRAAIDKGDVILDIGREGVIYYKQPVSYNGWSNQMADIKVAFAKVDIITDNKIYFNILGGGTEELETGKPEEDSKYHIVIPLMKVTRKTSAIRCAITGFVLSVVLGRVIYNQRDKSRVGTISVGIPITK